MVKNNLFYDPNPSELKVSILTSPIPNTHYYNAREMYLILAAYHRVTQIQSVFFSGLMGALYQASSHVRLDALNPL